MAGNREGGKKAVKTTKERHGGDFYQMIGSLGGSKGKEDGVSKGFGSDKVGADGLTGRERAKLAGAEGGRKSSRFGVPNPRKN